MLTAEQIVAAQKAIVEITFDVLNESLACVGKLLELNVRAVKSTLAENQQVQSMALSANEPHQLFLRQATHTKRAIEKAQSYWHGILSSTLAGVTALAEARLKQRQLGSRDTAKRASDITETDDSATASSAGSTAVPAVLE